MIMKMLNDSLNMDVHTLTSALFWGNLTSVILIVSYRFTSSSALDKHLYKYFLFSKSLQTIAFFLLYFRGYISDFLSVNIGNSLLFTGFFFEALSILRIIPVKNKKMKKILLGILVFTIFLFNMFEYLYPEPGLRVTNASISVLLILSVPTVLLVTSKKTTRFKRNVGFFYLLFLSLLLPRAVYALLHPQSSIFTNFTFQILSFISLLSLMLFSLPVFTLLMRENTDKIINSMATTDFLTGISNRYSFLNASNLLFEKSKTLGIGICILFLDIDYFKKVNDTYGHIFGDEVLKKLSTVIIDNIGINDIACRYGGEEFIVFLYDTDFAGGEITAKSIMSQIRKLSFKKYPEFTFTVSIGISYGIPKNDDDVSIFIDTADKALYQAKNTGRNKTITLQVSNEDET